MVPRLQQRIRHAKQLQRQTGLVGNQIHTLKNRTCRISLAKKNTSRLTNSKISVSVTISPHPSGSYMQRGRRGQLVRTNLSPSRMMLLDSSAVSPHFSPSPLLLFSFAIIYQTYSQFTETVCSWLVSHFHIICMCNFWPRKGGTGHLVFPVVALFKCFKWECLSMYKNNRNFAHMSSYMPKKLTGFASGLDGGSTATV